MKTIRVTAAVIRKGDRVFATARGYGDYKGGWEIREELDTDILVGDFIETIEYDYPSFHLSMDCFWCSIRSGSLTLREAEAARWLTADSLDSVNWLPADRSLIGKIRQGLMDR